MSHYLFKSIWIAFRIWMLAVFANAVIGTVVLSFDIASIQLFFAGCLIGAICALPVLFTQIIVIYTASSTGATGKTIFNQTIIAGEIATAVVVFLFFGLTSWTMDIMLLLLALSALVSGALATAFHIGALYEMGSDYNHIQTTNTCNHEN